MTHVLVARQDSMGDVLLAGPAVRAFAGAASKVTVLASPRGAAAAAMLPGVDDVMTWRAEWIAPDPRPIDREDVQGFVQRLEALEVSTLAILTSFHQSPLPLALLARLAGIPCIGAISEDYPGSLLDVRHHVGDDLHEVERGLSLAAALGFVLPPHDDGSLRVRVDLDRRPIEVESYVVVHPGADVPARAWNPVRLAELVTELHDRGDTVVVTGSPAERALTRMVAGRVGIDLGGVTDVAALAALLAHADALVSGNTGPAHLAAAVSCPVVSLFAPTVPASRWRPWMVPNAILGDQEIDCAGCRARACFREGHPCLDHVTVDEVADALDALRRTGTT